LQPRRQVRRLADDRLFVRRAFADQIPYDHQPGRDPDPRLEPDGFDIEAADRVDDAQPRTGRPFGIVLVGLRVAKIGKNTVPHVFSDKPVEPDDYSGYSTMIRRNHRAQILGIEPPGKRRRSDQIRAGPGVALQAVNDCF
jgi:hypothetical protein